DALAVATLKLARQQVSEPSLQEWDDAAHEEQPDTPRGGPEATARALADRPGVEAVVDQMLQVFAGSDLMHELVLVSVHAGELTDMVECVENAVGQLEGINVAQAVLDLRIDDKLSQSQNLSHQVERVSESGLLSLLCCQRL